MQKNGLIVGLVLGILSFHHSAWCQETDEQLLQFSLGQHQFFGPIVPELERIPTDPAHCEAWAGAAVQKFYDSCQRIILQSQAYHRGRHPIAAQKLKEELAAFSSMLESNPQAREFDRLQTEFKNKRSDLYTLSIRASRCSAATGEKPAPEKVYNSKELEREIFQTLGALKELDLPGRIASLQAELAKIDGVRPDWMDKAVLGDARCVAKAEPSTEEPRSSDQKKAPAKLTQAPPVQGQQVTAPGSANSPK